MSEHLFKMVKSYDDYVAHKGLDDAVIDAYKQAIEVALVGEKEIEYGMALGNRVKYAIAEFIKQQTGGTLTQLEKYCEEHQERYLIVDKYYEIQRAMAYNDFESYISYMEKDRPQEKRFYLPRKKTLHVVTQDLVDLDNRKIKYYGLSLPARTGKSVAINTPILTNHGWKNHGDLTLNDKVIGIDGKFKKIIAIHPRHSMEYKITFTDGESVICHGNHEWNVIKRGTNTVSTVETKEMLKNYKLLEQGHERNRYTLPYNKPVVGETKELAVEPYTLGAWLGDGTNRKPYITSPKCDYAIVEKIQKAYKLSTYHVHPITGVYTYSFDGLRTDLQKYGMCKSRETTVKHIPQEYLTASFEQRLELLAGLLDTDGTLMRKEHRYAYSTTEKQLKDDFVSLIHTFGWRTCVTEAKPRISTSGIHGRKTVYRIGFNPTFYIPCTIERKQLFEYSKQKNIAIDKIEPIETPIEGNCITVEDGVYCVGKTLKPTHNSTLCIFYLTWIGLKRPNSHSAMGGHSGALVKGFYKELLNLFTSEEYKFTDLYSYWHPNCEIIQDKSAEDYTINLDKRDRFSTITCRSSDATWTGAIDVSRDGVLYVDDLVRDREHSLSPQRMEATYQEYLNKMVDRKNDGAVELNVGTLWSVLDPMERMRVKYENDPMYRFRRIPALDENDHSNFDYAVNGFSSQYYIDMRDRLDEAEWMAKYQQRPFVREGLLFQKDELLWFDGIVPDEQHKTIAIVDPAVGGGDSLSMPICWVGERKYIIDWVYNKGTQKITVPLIVDKIQNHYITELYIEKNGVGRLFEDEIKRELKKRNINHCRVATYNAPNKISKEDKIRGYSDWIKTNLFFLLERKYTENIEGTQYVRSTEYENALLELHMYTSIGKNPHDDAPDSLAQMALIFEKHSNGTVEAVSNPFRIGYR